MIQKIQRILVLYLQDTKKFKSKGADQKAMVRKRTIQVKKAFKTQLGLNVDQRREGGFGNTKTGNVARKAFENPVATAQICGVSPMLVTNLEKQFTELWPWTRTSTQTNLMLFVRRLWRFTFLMLGGIIYLPHCTKSWCTEEKSSKPLRLPLGSQVKKEANQTLNLPGDFTSITQGKTVRAIQCMTCSTDSWM